MGKGNLAAIDLGTNSCRLRITDAYGNALYRTSVTTKLGEGMYEHQCFTPEAVERGVSCFEKYAEIMEDYDVVRYRAVATAACRMAANGADFVRLVKERSGINLEVIDPREEAVLNLKGALLNVPKEAEYVLVYDLGGGSTEITLARNAAEPEILHTVSIPWGARNASEAFELREYNAENAEKLRAEISRYVQEFRSVSHFDDYRGKCCCVATSSTPLRLLTMLNKAECYVKDLADGCVAETQDIDMVIQRILSMSVEEMAESVYIGENRAPIFVAACIIFKTIYGGLEITKLTASLKGALEAIICDLEQTWQN